MSVTKITEKFTDKKSKFNAYLNDVELFDCGDFNLVKLFQYAVFREEGFNARTYWKLPFWLLNIIFFVKRLRLKKKFFISKNSNYKILIADSHRYVETIDKQYKSRYFENILSYLNKEQTLFLNAHLYSSKVNHDYSLSQFYEYFSVLKLNDDDKELLKNLRRTYKKILSELKLDKNKTRILAEIIEIFFKEYRAYREFLKYFDIKIAFLFPHYQKEALIYALRKRNIKIIELQHGLIANEDMFYVYDKKILPVRDKALFADEIWVYGEYWKNVLLNGCEYNDSQIKIFGYYLFYEKNFSPQFLEFTQQLKSKYNTIVFATAQKNLESHLAGYINFLLNDIENKNQNAAILIKPHPSATQDISDFIDKKFSNVFVVNYPLEWLFQICDIHFSIYSTTLFDALMFNVKNNFALKHPLFEDYVEGIVKQNIAYELNMNENVLDKVNSTKHSSSHLNPKYFYADVNWDLLFNAVKSV